MDLNTLWFILITILFCGFFFLEGFDYGVAILLPFIGKKDIERRIVINTIGPFWDGNEVWMIVAVGAIFATFPNWYATLFSGFYLIAFIILFSLIIRGVSFEYRGKVENHKWKNVWDSTLFIGSLVPAFLWGVILTDLIIGIPIDKNMEFVGVFKDLVTPAAIVGGLVGLALFSFHGSIFLLLKTTGEVFEKARKAALKLGVAAICAEVLILIMTLIGGSLFAKTLSSVFAVTSLVLLLLAYMMIVIKKYKIAMITNGISVVMAVAAVFSGLYPRVMVSSLNPMYSLTITNSSSSSYTLNIITIASLLLLPVVIAYQVWSYWIFRKRVNAKSLEY